MCRLKIIAIGRCCKTSEYNENCSSKILEGQSYIQPFILGEMF